MAVNWRASSLAAKNDAKSPPAKKQKPGGGGSDEEMAEEEKSGERAAEGGEPQKRTRSKTGAPSAGTAARSRGGTNAKPGEGGQKVLNNKELSQAVSLLAKASLSTHDSVRELQANLGYIYMYAPADNPIMAANVEEGQSFFKVKSAALKDLANAPQEKKDEKLKELGSATASQLLAVFEKLVDNKPQEAEKEALAHWQQIQKLHEQLSQSTQAEVSRVAGTWQTRKAHGTTKKLIIRPNLEPRPLTSLVFLCRRGGMKVHTDQKAPRDGLHRAVQGILE